MEQEEQYQSRIFILLKAFLIYRMLSPWISRVYLWTLRRIVILHVHIALFSEYADIRKLRRSKEKNIINVCVF